MAEGTVSGQAALFQALETRQANLTPSERAISAWIRGNIGVVPYSTGAKMAAAIGVSEMTLIRFLRSLGYGNLRDLKDQLRPSLQADTSPLDDVAARFTSSVADIGSLAKSLELELAAVHRTYELAATPEWDRIVALIAKTPLIHIVGFQAAQGIALDFASRLKYVRGGIRAAHGSAGVFAEVLESDPATTLIFIVDTAAYARKGVLLARKAAQFGIPLVIMTDRYSHWAREFTDHVIELNTQAGTYWDSAASLSVATNLLIHLTAGRIGASAFERFEMMRALGEHFQEFDPAASRFGELRRKRALRDGDG